MREFGAEGSFGAASQPGLQLWRDLRPRIGVISIEPCTIGRQAVGSNEQVQVIEPGQSISFDVELVLAS